jgi:hypothetical protein
MKCSDSTRSPSSVHRCLCQIGTSQSARTDSDSAKISSDSIRLRGIPHRNGVEYVGESKDLGFKGLDQESWKSLHPDGLHQESIWRIPGAHQGSMMVHNGCYLKRGPDGLQEDS